MTNIALLRLVTVIIRTQSTQELLLMWFSQLRIIHCTGLA